MRRRRRAGSKPLPRLAAAAFAGALVTADVLAAEFRPAPHEVWAGTYRCDAIEHDPARWPAYSATIRLALDDRTAHITKESARILETMTGNVADNGTLTLEGDGGRKDGSGTRWRYRFDGQFEGNRFQAQGAMLSPTMASKLRACSMTLTRVSASHTAKKAAQPALTKGKPPHAPLPQEVRAPSPASPLRAVESETAPAVTHISPPVPHVAAEQARSDSPDVSKTSNAPVAPRSVARAASERPATDESHWRIRAACLIAFVALAAVATVIDRSVLK